MKQLFTFGLLLSLCSLLAARAQPSEDGVLRLRGTLQLIPIPELPAVAAQAIRQSGSTQRPEVARLIIDVVALRAPSQLPAVVAAIGSVSHVTAPMAAAAAVRNSPAQATQILNAAVQVAPAFAEETGRAVLAVVPAPTLRVLPPPPKAVGGVQAPRISVGPAPQPRIDPFATVPGTIRGAHPTVPPEPVPGPTLGRDPSRR